MGGVEFALHAFLATSDVRAIASRSIGDDASSLPGLVAILISGFFYAYIVNVLQERQKMCDERDAGILAAVAWMAGVVHMISALWKVWRRE